MHEDLEQLLKNLRLKRVAELLDEELRLAEEQALPVEKLLARLLRAEWQHRQEGALTWRIKNAKLPESWTLESFPFKKQPGVSQRQIRTFAELDFVPKAENIVFCGPTGVGKTGLATGLLLKALQNGYRGAFIKAQDLFDEMYASLADRSTRKLLKQLARLDVLVIDEMGYLRRCRSAGALELDEVASKLGTAALERIDTFICSCFDQSRRLIITTTAPSQRDLFGVGDRNRVEARFRSAGRIVQIGPWGGAPC